MVKNTKKRVMITLTKEAAKLIQMRGGSKYIEKALAELICSKETPSCYELEECGLYKQRQAVYETIAIHKEGYNWYKRLFPGVYNDK